MIEPTLPLAPGTGSWAEQYGPIGVIAALAIGVLVYWLRAFFAERKDDRERQNREADEVARRNTELSDKLVEQMTVHHRETLELVTRLTLQNEQKYQALLERHISETRGNAEALRAQSSATTEALSGMIKKLSKHSE